MTGSLYDCLYGQDIKSKKNTKMAAIQKLQFRITKYLMCIYGDYLWICIPKMKFLCLTQCQGVLHTDGDANDDGKCMIV